MTKIFNQKSGTESAIVYSAIFIPQDYLKKLRQLLKTSLGLDMELENKIDKNIIGGFYIRSGDWFLDATISSDLEQIKKSLI